MRYGSYILGLLTILFFAAPVSAAESYRLGPDDVLKVEVWGEEELSGTYIVSERGTIRRSWLPEIKVVGMSVDEAAAALTAELKKYMKEPRLKVEVAEYKSHRVTLIGGVVNPGQYALSDKRNLFSLLLKAGGLSPQAVGEAVILKAPSKDGAVSRINIDVNKLLNQGDVTQDAQLGAGDVVYFPVAGGPGGSGSPAQTVIVTGAVNKMGTFPFREGYTALNAVIDAGGFTKFASPNRARIMRGQGKDEKTIRIELGDVVNRGDKTKNVALMPGDILVIPESLL